MWHQEYLKRAFFCAMSSYMTSKEVKREKVRQMRGALDERLKTRVILALKYYLLC